MPEEGQSNRRMMLLGGLAVILVAGIVAYALMQGAPPTAAPPAISIAAATPPATSRSQPSASVSLPASSLVAEASPAASPDPSGDAPAWESKIDNVLQSDVNETQMAQILIGMLPTLPEDGQVEAANHITNLLPDADYATVKPLLLNPDLPESVQSVFFSDLMNRNDDTKLKAFLQIAQEPNHPFHDEALSDLQIYVGDDYGQDWAKWGTAVDQYLKTANEQ